MKNLQNTIVAAVMLPLLAIIPALDTLSHPLEKDEDPSSTEERLVLTQANALLPISSPSSPHRVLKTMEVLITAYSSTHDQTWGDPFITASGKRVKEGIVAANMLSLGTKIKIPELFGEKVFVVEDRMHPRNYGKVDIWFPTREEAKSFGVRQAIIAVLER